MIEGELHVWGPRELELARRLAERLDDRDLDFVFTTARPPGTPAALLELEEDR